MLEHILFNDWLAERVRSAIIRMRKNFVELIKKTEKKRTGRLSKKLFGTNLRGMLYDELHGYRDIGDYEMKAKGSNPFNKIKDKNAKMAFSKTAKTVKPVAKDKNSTRRKMVKPTKKATI